MSRTDNPPPQGGPLPPDPEFLEQQLSPAEQTGLQTTLATLGVPLDELPQASLPYAFWSTVAAVHLMGDFEERHDWSPTRVRTQAAHMLGVPESTLRDRLDSLPGR